MNWYLEVLKKYAVFDGRAHRTEYWMFALINILIVIGLTIVDVTLFGSNGEGPAVLSGLYGLGVLLPSIAVGVRRLHDTGKSGWWMLIAFIPLVGPIVLIVFMATKGDSGTNDYGADPWSDAA